MRKLLFLALLATAATPALAQRGRGFEHVGDGPRAEAPGRGYWQSRGDGGSGQAQVQRQWRGDGGGQQVQREWRGGGNGDAGAGARWRDRQVQPAVDVDAGAAERYRQREPMPSGTWTRPVTTAPVSTYRQRIDSTADRYRGDRRGYTSPAYPRQWDGNRVSSWSGSRDGRWTNAWRQNPRYDWRSYRSQNRALYSIGRYYDPFGYGYRPVSIGFTLYSGYYQPSYWLDDPWQYRLPPVYGPYRWVRYWNDAVLVDIYTGEVVDVIRDFFW